MSIAWKPEEASDALKEFVGQVVATDYAEEPFNMKGAPDIKRAGKVFCVKIRTNAYEKDQYEWYTPSRVKKTKPVAADSFFGSDLLLCRDRPIDCSGVKSVWSNYYGDTYRTFTSVNRSNHTGVIWVYFIEALNLCGAMRDLSIAGANDEERMQSLSRSMLGMEFRWEERECESLVKERGGGLKKFSLLLPVEYLGKRPIEAAPEVRQVEISEPAGESEAVM